MDWMDPQSTHQSRKGVWPAGGREALGQAIG